MRTDLSDNSKVWIYQAERQLSENEVAYIREELSGFCKGWTAHNLALKASFDVLYNRFVVLVVDETLTDASGCSIDKSVKQMREISAHLGLDFFNRLNLAFLENDEVKTIPMHAIEEQLSEGKIKQGSLFFNTLVSKLGALKNDFLLPIEQHWINKTFK